MAAWFTFLLAGPVLVLLMLALGFITLYLFESRGMNKVSRPEYYLTLRLRVTALVVLAHGLMLLKL